MSDANPNGMILPRMPISSAPKVKGIKQLSNRLWIAMLWLCGLVTLVILLVIIGYVMIRGLGVIDWDFLARSPYNMGRSGGIYPMIAGSVAITLIAILVSTPLSVCAAIYMSEYARQNGLATLVRFGADCLAGIPSIMFGMFGYIFFVYYLRFGYSLLAGGLTLAIMALPIILRVSEEAIKVVPRPYRLGSLALGATKWQTIRKVVLPAALPGIATGIILGMGRAVGETAAVYLTAGSVARVPTSLFSPVETLTLHVYGLVMNGISEQNAFGTSALLIIMILAITITSNIITRRFMAKLGGKIS